MRTDSKTSRTVMILVVISFVIALLSLALENFGPVARDVGYLIAMLVFAVAAVLWVRNKR